MPDVMKRLKTGTFFGLILQGGVGLLSIAVAGILARMLDAVELGIFFLCITLVRFVAILTGFGLSEGIQKFVGISFENGNWAETRSVLKKTAWLFTVSTVIVSISFMLLWPYLVTGMLDDALSLAMGMIVIGLIVFRALEQIGAAYFRAIQKQILGLFFLGTPRELLFVVTLLVAWFMSGSLNLQNALVLYFSGGILITIALALIFRRTLYGHATADENKTGISIGDYASFCWPVVLHLSLVTLFNSVDMWVLGIYREMEDVSLYGAALRLVILIPFTLHVINLVLPSMVAALSHRGKIKQLSLLARTASTWSFLLGGFICLVFILFGDLILQLVYGPAFEEGLYVLIILAIGQVINATCGSPGVVLQMTGHQALLMRITLLTTTINIIFNVLVVERYGAVGVASVTAFSLFIQNVASTYYAYKKVGVVTVPHPGMLRPKFVKHLFRR